MTSHTLPLWISEADVIAVMDLRQAVQALQDCLIAEAHDDARNMLKTHVEWRNGATLHAIGATFPKAGCVGTKTWAHTEGGATPLLILFDSNEGTLKAIIEAFALGQLRTAAASGVATRWLASSDADDLAVIGTGKQALAQLAAILAVRSIRRIRVFSPNAIHRAEFAERAQAQLGVPILCANSVSDAVRGANIITLITRATEPILSADMVAPGAHINSVGAIVPSRAEVSRDVVARSTQIVTDSVSQAHKLSRELIDYFSTEPDKWTSVQSLATVVANRNTRRPGDDLTLFKSLGVGISDVAVGMQVYRRALDLGLGQTLPQPRKVPLQFRVSESVKN